MDGFNQTHFRTRNTALMTNFLSSIKPGKSHFLFLSGADLCVGTEVGIDQRRECSLKSMGPHG